MLDPADIIILVCKKMKTGTDVSSMGATLRNRRRFALAAAFFAAACAPVQDDIAGPERNTEPAQRRDPVTVQASTPWHLKNPQTISRHSATRIDMNVDPLRGAVTGKGCRVAVNEYFNNKNDYKHANLVSTLINNQPLRPNPPAGIAPDAQVTIHDVDREYDHALFQEIDVVNRSVQSSLPYSGSNTTHNLTDSLTRNGRGGLGAVFFSAAGNMGKPHYESDKQRADTMVVGNIDARGRINPSSAHGPYIYAVAPGTNLSAVGQGPVSGTSFSTPLASGAACLMLEANPNLGYRDIQEIIALSARRSVITGAPFHRNTAKTLNGGGYGFRADAGFGLIDTHAAVRMAETWEQKSTAANQHVFRVSSPAGKMLDHRNPMSGAALLPATPMRVEHVFLRFRGLRFHVEPGATWPEDLRLVLTSPSGTRIDIFVPVTDSMRNGPENFTLSHVAGTHFLRGEDAFGVWSLTLEAPADMNASLEGWSLDIRAAEQTRDTRHTFTKDYTPGKVAPVLVDADGGYDTLDLSGLTDNVILYLDGERASSLGGKPLKINDGTIEAVITGDGNDTIFTSRIGNTVTAGRGDDIIAVQGGNNRITYRVGIDGADIIVPTPGASGHLVLKNLSSPKAVTSRKSGNDIVLNFPGNAGSITLRNGAIYPFVRGMILPGTGSDTVHPIPGP